MNPPADGWGMIDNDTSPFADHGYGDWAELPGGDVYAVNYLVDTASEDRPQIRGYRLRRDELLAPSRNLVVDFAPPEYRRGKLAGQAGWVRQIPELWRTTEWLEQVDYGPLGNNVVIDGERMTGSRNVGGLEEVVRRDVGPYDLEREVVELTVTHRGRQRVAILRLDDQDANTIVELRSDSVYEELWARDNRSVPYLSGIEVGAEWWRTTIRLGRRPRGGSYAAQGRRHRRRSSLGHGGARRNLPAPLRAGRDRRGPRRCRRLLRGQHPDRCPQRCRSIGLGQRG